jgi:GH35 family endo-1,4-beta-xylanase
MIIFWGFLLTTVLEPFNDDGTFGQNVFSNTTGMAYISTALKAARAADPAAKLYVREEHKPHGSLLITSVYRSMISILKELERNLQPWLIWSRSSKQKESR